MIKVAQLSVTRRGQALALALMVSGLIALAGVGGYEVGTAADPTRAAQAQAIQPQACGAQDAPPATGLQP